MALRLISPPPENLQCSICLCEIEEMDEGMTATKMRCCGGGFHTDCLEQWRKRSKKTCPNCRSTMSHNFLEGRTGYTPLITTFIPYFDNDVAISSPTNPTTPSGLPPRRPNSHSTSSKKSQIIRNALENVDQWLG
ncbi:hypothetical protein TrRE_jg11904 [Triparma retinervis]|uniref:RING-type domain-containing protein n=1 Tax=Triparma retinervis TaxID=2557542 RepID=A0A9W7DV20_9STRA|nr:hypothetical protein TrRE_jg11904 [Triparma retinervis]